MSKDKVIGFLAARWSDGDPEIVKQRLSFYLPSLNFDPNSAGYAEGVDAYHKLIKTVAPFGEFSQFYKADYWGRVYWELFSDAQAAWDCYSINERVPLGDRDAFLRGFGITKEEMIMVGSLLITPSLLKRAMEMEDLGDE